VDRLARIGVLRTGEPPLAEIAAMQEAVSALTGAGGSPSAQELKGG
jgi:hypothetical protein